MNESELNRVADGIERISMVLGVILATNLGDVEPKVKAQQLSNCGYLNTEIADLLGTTTNAINVALHRARKSKGKKVPRSKSKK